MDKPEIKEAVENPEEVGPKKNVAEGTGQENAAVEAAQESEAVLKLKEELEAAKDKYIRLYSEFENFRKRTSKEKLDLIQSANEQLLKTLIPVVDDFERAENAFADKNHPDLAGIFLIHSKFKKVLDLYGLKTMEVGAGTEFNPDLHEAITQIPAAEELKGKVVDVVEKGYVLNDKVMRHAKVVVGK